ncbi:flagellar export chaperone FliS [Heliorestis acidaminivorans]|uniref:flagellar export chaperone FliS n=1 Tax=Heliorestis acidaminivorans TaxID=553427 RepID=UPI001A9C1CE3|nr:flagellar export chaperone FliS [Heliorestis acidaminivorans]
MLKPKHIIMTATPQELTLLLYQGAIKFMNQAIHNTKEKNYAEANQASKRAQDIFGELMSTFGYED